MALAAATSAPALTAGLVGLSSAASSSSNAVLVSTASSASAMFGTMSLWRGKANSGRHGRKEVTPAWFRGMVVSARAVAMQDSLTGMDEDSEGVGDLGLGQREIRQYPPGLQRYETMAVLRPDLSEEQRLTLTHRYEEAIIAGGGLDVEMFNRGMQPLAYNIKTKNMGGVASRYLDGIYLLFTYVTKPDSQLALQKKLNADDDIIRSTTFRLKA